MSYSLGPYVYHTSQSAPTLYIPTVSRHRNWAERERERERGGGPQPLS